MPLLRMTLSYPFPLAVRQIAGRRWTVPARWQEMTALERVLNGLMSARKRPPAQCTPSVKCWLAKHRQLQRRSQTCPLEEKWTLCRSSLMVLVVNVLLPLRPAATSSRGGGGRLVSYVWLVGSKLQRVDPWLGAWFVWCRKTWIGIVDRWIGNC